MAATGADGTPPPACPLTGAPAAALLQRVSSTLLRRFWRFGAGVRHTPLPAAPTPIGLWRSPCGLAFFHPAIEGDGRFYAEFYGRHAAHRVMSRHAGARRDFRAAAAHVAPGARVLDLGCGGGAFAGHLPPGALYQGIDPHAGPDARARGVLAEGAAEHAAARGEAYDAACAFQVLEHVADPLGLVRDLLRCLRPGGLLILSVPLWPSAYTSLPNCLISAPPHHLTWWTEEACAALAARLGLEVVAVEALPASPHQAMLAWAARLSPVRAGAGKHFRASWLWHGSALFGLLAGRLLAPLGPPRDAGPLDMLLVARKPPAH